MTAKCSNLKWTGLALAAALTGSCDLSESGSSDAPVDVTTRTSGLTAQQRLTACAQDPRVVTGLATRAGLRGRRHLLPGDVQRQRAHLRVVPPGAEQLHDRLRASSPTLPASDPLFVFERDANLDEPGDRFAAPAGGILENVDGFEDPTHKFVDPVGAAHAVARDQHHPRSGRRRPPTPPEQRTGWGGDGGSRLELPRRPRIDAALHQDAAARARRRLPRRHRRRSWTWSQQFQLALGRTQRAGPHAR